jgi:hypothetical protein
VVLADAAFGYARGGYEVVVDGIVGPWFLDPFRGLARQTGIPLHCVVLRLELGAALERPRTRAGPSRIASGPIRSLHAQLNWAGPAGGRGDRHGTG